MTISLELWHFILLVIAFLGALAAAGKLLLSQVLASMDDRFRAQEAAAAAYQAQLARRLDTMDADTRAERDQWQRVERDFMNFKGELPLQYVRREDYVQAVATIMAKLDGMALRFENILLRSNKHDT